MRACLSTRAHPLALLLCVPVIQRMTIHIADILHRFGVGMVNLRLDNCLDLPDRDVGPGDILGAAVDNIIVGHRPHFIGALDLNQLPVSFVSKHATLDAHPPVEEALLIDADDLAVQRVIFTQVQLPDVPLFGFASKLSPPAHAASCKKYCDNYHTKISFQYVAELQNPVLGLVTFYFNTLFDFCQKHKIRARCDLCS